MSDKTIFGCEFAGPGRGDCEHFIGVPESPTEYDTYGRPIEWCWFCWHSYQIDKMKSLLRELWEDDEMGWIVDGAGHKECVKCGTKTNVHDPECWQGKFLKVL